MNKIVLCFGTRPELIKVAPIIWEFSKHEKRNQLIVVNTSQHVHTASESEFDIKSDYQLNVFKKGQSLNQLNSKLISQLDILLDQIKSNSVCIKAILAQGDTSTTYCTAQVAFLMKIPFYHIEAGFRTNRIKSPFPEEFYRKSIGIFADLHFVPTIIQQQNLLKEGVEEKRIKITGNTINDILMKFHSRIKRKSNPKKKLVLITIHRRENQECNLDLIIESVNLLASQNKDIHFKWLSHPSPIIQEKLNSAVIRNSNFEIQKFVSYSKMVEFYASCLTVISDSGGILEETAFLGIPRIIVRQNIERKSLLNLDNSFTFNPQKECLLAIFKKAIVSKNIPCYHYGKGNSAELIFSAIMEEHLIKSKSYSLS